MAGSKIVKRYANRKLYDTEQSSYVTLDDIATMIRAGEELQVVDNKTGEDLTSVTLAQIIFEAEKKRSFMPLGLLRHLIRDSGDALGEFARDRVDKVHAAAYDFRSKAQNIRSEWEDRIDRVIGRKGEKDADGSELNSDADTLTDGLRKAKHPKLLKEMGELLATSQSAFDEFQRNMEERLKGGVGNISRYAHLGRDMEEIRKRLEALEERLESLHLREG